MALGARINLWVLVLGEAVASDLAAVCVSVLVSRMCLPDVFVAEASEGLVKMDAFVFRVCLPIVSIRFAKP